MFVEGCRVTASVGQSTEHRGNDPFPVPDVSLEPQGTVITKGR